MKLFKLIEIDMEKERAKINAPGTYNKRQRRALLKLCDLFEAGEWQACLDHVNDQTAFPYNRQEGYYETEHVGVRIDGVLHALQFDNFYTQDQLLKEALEKLASGKSQDRAQAPKKPVSPKRIRPK